MGYRVSTAGFEGPFDLLLQLVMRQKVDIGAVSVGAVADQYLEEVSRMGDLDLEVASDFVLVAATLLDLKAAALVPTEDAVPQRDGLDELDLESLSPEEIRDVLVERLMAYRQFRSAAASLDARAATERRMHPRTCGPDPEFLSVMPDYLAGVELSTLASMCARFVGRRERLLLESEHIAPRRIPLEVRVGEVDARVRAAGHMTFDELVEDDPSVPNRVVSILALLELSKRDIVRLEQQEVFGEIAIDAVAGAPTLADAMAGGGFSVEGPAPGESARDGSDDSMDDDTIEGEG